MKSIAEQAEEESTEAWVDKLRRTQKEKEIAEQRVWSKQNAISLVTQTHSLHALEKVWWTPISSLWILVYFVFTDAIRFI